MDLLQNIITGFQVSLQPMNLLYCFFGAAIGTLIGVLPGIGPAGTIALLLPISFNIPPVSAIILLSGIYYGSMYGGSITSILVNIPGEAASVITCIDGYEMAKKGRAGPALGISALGSFIGGTIGIFGLMLLTPPMAKAAKQFGAPEYFGLVCLGLSLLVYLGGGSIQKSLISAIVGLILSFIGQDIFTGEDRFTFGIIELKDGINLVALFMGFFGISEVLMGLEQPIRREILKTNLRNLFPNLKDWVDSIGAILRGTLIGFFLGAIPGGSAVIASFASYAVEKKVSKYPERFGTGVIEGVAGPETANNAAAQGAFIPLLGLGIPANVTMALLLGAFMLHGIRPGPIMIERHPDLFWGIVTSMYVGNAMLLLFNLPLIGVWIQILRVPYRILFPLIIIFCLIGSYSVNNSTFDILTMIVFGIIGYVFRKMGFEGAPLVLAFILGSMLEQSLRQSLIMSHGNISIFITRPIAAGCLLLTILMFLSSLFPFLKKKMVYLWTAKP
jgi:putative tricarboxylic transport membrane protein